MSNRGLDTSEALRLPGVVDVITAEDIPGKKVRSMFGYHEELLAESEVEFLYVYVFVFTVYSLHSEYRPCP